MSLFNIFKKKENQIQELIDQDGLEHVTLRFAQVICEMLQTKELAYQFILEEIEAASGGNHEAMMFAEKSGILPQEYSGAMYNSVPEIDGENGPQQFLINICSALISNQELMVRFRLGIDENIMKMFKLGKYADKNDITENQLRSLKELLEEDNAVMPSLTKNIPIPEKSMAKHISRREVNINSAKELVDMLIKSTGEDIDAIILMALKR